MSDGLLVAAGPGGRRGGAPLQRRRGTCCAVRRRWGNLGGRRLPRPGSERRHALPPRALGVTDGMPVRLGQVPSVRAPACVLTVPAVPLTGPDRHVTR